MTKYLEAPDTIDSVKGKSIFLAGGITGCVDWQKIAKKALMESREYALIVNPRREDFDIGDDEVANAQIKWEAEYLQYCSDIMFWFSNETVQPITLFELGMYSTLNDNIFVGCDPVYSRRFDVITQLGIYRPDIKVWDNLDDMLEHITTGEK